MLLGKKVRKRRGESMTPTIVPLSRGLIYLPSVMAHSLPVAPVGEPLSVEKQIYLMMALHPYQGRKGMQWHDKLALIAYWHCYAQAHRGFSGHVDPDGIGPNYRVRFAGYKLPEWYNQDKSANNIESLSHNGSGRPDEMWNGLLNSEAHRIHVLGLNNFYAQQVCVGVGYYHLEGSAKTHYWCVLSAPVEGSL